jgi:hypothetical protein
MSTATYEKFLTDRRQLADMGGFEPIDLPDYLFPFQRLLVDWAIRHGRCGMFADCGMGKTPMSLVWANNVYRHTGRPILYLTPLAVGFQAVKEAHKFGLDAAMSRDGQIVAPITITNYEQIEKFDSEHFGGVVCDESSSIKSYDGTRRALVTEFMRTVPYRLLATATAAPNDYTELGTSSEALGHLGYIDMLNRFFTNKQKTSDIRGKYHSKGGDNDWRFKGHAEEPFWRWVASWARAIRRPSDYGFDNGDFVLPPLDHRITQVTARESRPDRLFDLPAQGLHEEREEQRRTIVERCEAAAANIADADYAVAWCHLNDESRHLSKMIDGAVELSGSDSVEAKEEKLHAFSDGEIRVLVTKPIIGAWGLNWQHCNRMSYFPSHSYEQYYQAVRRSWRFGQTRPVLIDIITTEGGRGMLENLQRKSDQADAMFESLVAHMNHAINIDQSTNFTTPMEVPTWLS